MDTVMQRILAIEKEACRILDKAEEEQTALPDEIRNKLSDISSERMEHAKTRLRQLTDEDNKKTEKEINKISARTEKAIENLSRVEDDMIEKWANDIFKSVVGR